MSGCAGGCGRKAATNTAAMKGNPAVAAVKALMGKQGLQGKAATVRKVERKSRPEQVTKNE